MNQQTKDLLNKIAIFVYTIIANVAFIGGTIYMAVCGDYSLFSVLAFGFISIGITLLWDIAVAISFSTKCSILYDKLKEWVKKH